MENSIRIIKYNLNYVNRELIGEFINNKGKCNDSTYNIINWDYILDSDNSINEILDTKSIKKLYISYLIKLFSQYLIDDDSKVLLKLDSCFKETFLNSLQLQYSIIEDLKKIFLKKIAFKLKEDLFGEKSAEFNEIIKNNQDLVKCTETFDEYSNNDLFQDICKILKEASYLDDASLLKTVLVLSKQEKSGNKNYNNLIEYFEKESSEIIEPINEKEKHIANENFDQDSNSSIIIIQDPDESKSSQNHDFEYVGYPQSKKRKIEETSDSFLNLKENKSGLIKEEVLEDTRTLLFENLKRNKHYSWTDSENDDDLHEIKNDDSSWSEDECVILVYISGKLGRDWTKIQTIFKKFFKNKNAIQMSKMFKSFIENDSLEGFMKKSAIIKDIEIIDKLITEAKNKIKPSYWTHEQTIYLVHFIQKYGKEWELLSKAFSKKFNIDHSLNAYLKKIKYLEGHPKELEFFKKQTEKK